MEFFYKRDGLDINPDKLMGHKPSGSKIIATFDGATVFITGATGFIGKVLLEALLRKVRCIKKIYILVREKKGKSPDERLRMEFDDLVYHRLKKVFPEGISKVEVMIGDIAQPGCGLRPEDVVKIKQEVNFFFHIAAALRFDEPIRSAFHSNVRATQTFLDIAMETRNLKAFVHVSTAYSHPYLEEVNEQFYNSTFSVEDIQNLVDAASDEEIGALSPLLIGHSINSYCMTKAIGESMVQQYVGRIPVCIVRPSIVLGCDREPLHSWINNIYGPTGVATGAYAGLIKVWFGDVSKKADMVPADYVINVALCAAYETADRYSNKLPPVPTPIYNATNAISNPVTWGDYMRLLEKPALTELLTSKMMIGTYSLYHTSNKIAYHLCVFIYHLLPALVMDLGLIVAGKAPRLLNGYKKVYNLNSKLGFYVHNEWVFRQSNVEILRSKMSLIDGIMFPMDMGRVNWEGHLSHTLRAIRLYILKDPYETLFSSRTKYYRMFYAFALLKGMIIIPMLYVLFKLLTRFPSIVTPY